MHRSLTHLLRTSAITGEARLCLRVMGGGEGGRGNFAPRNAPGAGPQMSPLYRRFGDIQPNVQRVQNQSPRGGAWNALQRSLGAHSQEIAGYNNRHGRGNGRPDFFGNLFSGANAMLSGLAAGRGPDGNPLPGPNQLQPGAGPQAAPDAVPATLVELNTQVQAFNKAQANVTLTIVQAADGTHTVTATARPPAGAQEEITKSVRGLDFPAPAAFDAGTFTWTGLTLEQAHRSLLQLQPFTEAQIQERFRTALNNFAPQANIQQAFQRQLPARPVVNQRNAMVAARQIPPAQARVLGTILNAPANAQIGDAASGIRLFASLPNTIRDQVLAPGGAVPANIDGWTEDQLKAVRAFVAALTDEQKTALRAGRNALNFTTMIYETFGPA